MSLNTVLWSSWLGSITATRNQTVFNSIQYNYIIDQQSKISLKNSQCDGRELIHYPELALQQKPVVSFCFFRNIYLFIYGWVFVAALGLSLVVAERGIPLYASRRGLCFVMVCGLLTMVASFVVERGLQVRGLQELRSPGLAATWHVEPSQTRDQNCVPYIGR